HGAVPHRRHLRAPIQVERGDRRLAAVNLDEPLFQWTLHPAWQGFQQDRPGRASGGHAEAGDRLRSEQQVRALPARAGAATGGTCRRSEARVRDRGAAAGRHQMILVRAAGVFAAALALLQSTPQPNVWSVRFVDVADRAGLRATSVYGGLDRKRFIIETNGAGVAFVDYDNDGWIDALVLSGVRLESGTREMATYAPGTAPVSHLYRNNPDGTFTDVTERSGLRLVGWASSVCAGDYDNDGWIDLAVTYYGENVLYRNRGDGTFEDVTRRAGLPTGGTRWGSGCTFLDYDRDGRADLFVANYLRFDLAAAPEVGKGPNCVWKGVPVNCGPRGLPTDTNQLFHNNGDGTFSDVSARSGVSKVTGRYSMTATATDVDNDGWIDIYVACDSTASILYHYNTEVHFTD